MSGIEFMNASSSYNKAGKLQQKPAELPKNDFNQAVNNFKQQLSNVQASMTTPINQENTRVDKKHKTNSVLSSLLGDNVSKISNAESVHLNALEGKASVADVVTAASEAEIALKEIMTLRDKLVDAFNKITESAI